MAKHMLIDATHPEETRVVVVDGKRLEEFDIELASKKQLKGNIYLAKVTRVEPSLQAAFVEYGGNRHGFLAFSEIHPDYYRIPVADREALLAAEAREAAAEEAREDAREAAAEARSSGRRRGGGGGSSKAEAKRAQARSEAGDRPDDPDSDAGVPEDLWPSQALEFGRDRLASDETFDSDEDDRDLPQRSDAPAAEEPGSGASSWSEPSDPQAVDPEIGDAGRGTAAADGEPGSAHAEAPGSDNAETDEARGQNGSGETLPAADESTGEVVQAEVSQVPVEVIGGDEIEEVQPRRSPRGLRSYKIQEVIKRRQVMLVQVTKEERGTKGAALTTYLSLAGRYCVLMPNTARGGGVSRKISSPVDRKRLKAILEELDIPEGMAVIIRTAGAERSKAELKRDYEYLLRLWDEIRELTLKSSAPALVYEEANLIKRSIRDLYSRDIEDVIVDGEEGYKVAKSFMRTLTPSHAKRVQLYRDPMPLLHRYQVESQLDAIHNPVVQLKSGGYIVINSTEALVAIDVNSGRATRERNIEETAYKTNLEAAEEIARQLRLRDLAGLIVIDFIDMDESRHNVAVERRVKESMRTDRARIQIGRISAFGLLELSRQRLRPSLFETSNELCQHCRGTGHVRSTESTALHVLRSIEDECLKSRNVVGLAVAVPTPVALYVLNHKRKALAEIELRHAMRIFLSGDDHLIPPEYRVERLKALAPGEQVRPPVMQAIAGPTVTEVDDVDDSDDQDDAEIEATAEARREPGAEGEDQGRKRTPRRRRRGGRDRDREPGRERAAPAAAAAADRNEAGAESDAADDVATGAEAASASGGAEGGAEERRRRRRGRRGGRRRRRTGEAGGESPSSAATADDGDFDAPNDEGSGGDERGGAEAAAASEDAAGPEGDRRRRRRSRRPSEAKRNAAATESPSAEDTALPGSVDDTPPSTAPEPAVTGEAAWRPAPAELVSETAEAPLAAADEPWSPVAIATETAKPAETPAPTSASEPEAAPAAPRKGWWRRLAK